MSNNPTSITDLLERLRSDGTFEEVVKEASESLVNADTEEEVKEAEENTEANEDVDENGVDLNKLAAKVAEIMNATPEKGLDKVASLVDELNKEAAELGASQDMIVTALYNGYFSDSELDTGDIVKMASEEDSIVPYIVDHLYKYAATADSMLAEKYDEDYDENDVIKMAAVLIDSTPDPFGFEQIEKEAEAEKEAEEANNDNALEELAEEFVSKIKQKLNN